MQPSTGDSHMTQPMTTTQPDTRASTSRSAPNPFLALDADYVQKLIETRGLGAPSRDPFEYTNAAQKTAHQ